MKHWSDDWFPEEADDRIGYPLNPKKIPLTLGQFQEVKRLAIQAKMDNVRQELRIEFAKLPRFARWLSAKFWPELFNNL